MRFIAVTAIIINPLRQRQEFEPEAMQELKTSIEERGLLHPPVLRETPEGWVLVAGERRLRAVSEIYELGGVFNCDGEQVPDNMIPYTSLGELGELEAEEAELDENLKPIRHYYLGDAAAAAAAAAMRVSTHSHATTADRAAASGVVIGASSVFTVSPPFLVCRPRAARDASRLHLHSRPWPSAGSRRHGVVQGIISLP